MASKSNGGKRNENKEVSTILYNGSFPNTTNIPGALSSSNDDQLCLITESGVHILQQKTAFPDLTPALKFALGFLKNPTKENAYDVDINPYSFCFNPTEFDDSYSYVLDRCLNPNKANLAPSRFTEAAWSPVDFFPHGRCQLALLSSNNRVYYVEKELHTRIYNIKLDFTQVLFEHYKSHNFEDENFKEISATQDQLSKISSEFHCYRKKQYYLAVTGIKWCPCTFSWNSNEEIISCSQNSDKEEGNAEDAMHNVFALLCGCNKLGMIIIWKVNIDTRNDDLVADFLSSIQLCNEQATTVAWYQEAHSSIGYIAVAFSNGFIKLCVIQTLIAGKSMEIKELQRFDLWEEDDLMKISFMEWIKKNDNLYLVSIKQSHIIVFQMNLDHHGNVCIHSYSIAPSIHDVPITALHCKGNSILTSDEDGVTQHWQLGQDEGITINNICKPGYNSYGMQLSQNGFMLFRLLCPTSIIYVQGRNVRNMELVVTPFKSLTMVADWTRDGETPADFEWYEVCRVLAHQYDTQPLLEAYKSLFNDELLSVAQLQKKSFVHWLLNTKNESMEKSFEILDFELVLQRRVKERLKYGIDFIKNGGKLDDKCRKLLLLAADWITIKAIKRADFEDAISIFDALHDSESQSAAEKIWALRNATQASNSEEKVEPGTLEPRMPPREHCPVCKCRIWMLNEKTGTCERGHSWKRCSLTFAILPDLKIRKCVYCNRFASWRSEDFLNRAPIYCKFVNVNRCPLCNCRLILYD